MNCGVIGSDWSLCIATVGSPDTYLIILSTYHCLFSTCVWVTKTVWTHVWNSCKNSGASWSPVLPTWSSQWWEEPRTSDWMERWETPSPMDSSRLASLSMAWHMQGCLPCLLLDTYRVGFLVYCLTHTGLASLSVAWHRVGIQYGLTHTGWLPWPWLHTYRVGFLVLGLTHTGLGWFSCLWLDTCRVGLASLSMAWCTQGWLPWPWLDTYRVGFLVYDLKYTCVRACVRACVCVRVCMCVQRRDQGMRGAEIEWTMLQLAFLSIWYWCMHL